MKKNRKLTDININEVSFVDVPANLIRFYIIKGANTQGNVNIMKRLIDVLKEFYGDTEVTFSKSIDPATMIAEIAKAMETITTYQSILPATVSDSIGIIAKSVVELLIAKSDENTGEENETDLEKGGKKVSNATATKLLEFRDVIDELVPEDIRKAHDEEGKPSSELAQVLDVLKKITTKEESDNKKEDEETVDELKKRLDSLDKIIAKKQSLDDGTKTKEKEDQLDEDVPFKALNEYFNETTQTTPGIKNMP